MDKATMIDIAEKSMFYQDIGEIDKQLALFSTDCTFKMPTNEVPMQGLDELRKSVASWPKAETTSEWFNAEESRLVMCWNWRGVGETWPKDAPLLPHIDL